MAKRRLTPAFDPFGALRVLTDAGVQFVVIGGFAGRLLGSTSFTDDLDVRYDRSPQNLDRLASTFEPLEARLRGVPDGVVAPLDRRLLDSAVNLMFDTKFGKLDALGEPAGGLTYGDLVEASSSVEIADGLIVPLISLDDLIQLKRAGGRQKDRIEVEVLEALREERRRTGRD